MSANPRTNMALGQLYTSDISEPVIQAMADVSRELFVPEHLQHCAYVDEDLKIAEERYLIEPVTLGKLLDAAEIKPTDKVLIVGCATGYGVTVAAKLADSVVGIDNNAALLKNAKENVIGLENVTLELVKNMTDGCAKKAPYDVIIILGAIEDIPESLAEQLNQGGSIVTVQHKAIRPGKTIGLGRGMLVKRVSHQLHYRELFDASIAKLEDFNVEASFTF